jgi:hypothetical protein
MVKPEHRKPRASAVTLKNQYFLDSGSSQRCKICRIGSTGSAEFSARDS